jgi:amidase
MFGQSQVGVHTRTVRDTAAVIDVLKGVETGDPVIAPNAGESFAAAARAGRSGLRIGLLDHDPGGVWPVDAAIAEAVRSTGELLESLGNTVETAWPSVMFDDAFTENWFTVLSPFASLWRDAALAKAGGEPDFDPITEYWADRGRALGSNEHIRALLWFDGFRRRMAAWWEGFDVLLTPVIPVLPRPLGAFWDRESGIRDSITILRFTPQFNTTGQPAIAVPAGTADGLPVAVQLAGRYGEDGLLLDLAQQIETARPWPRTAPLAAVP